MHKRILLAAILTIAAAVANASTLDQAFDRTFDVRPGAVFGLTNTNGHITVRSWDQPRIRVHAVKHVESRDNDAARDAMKAITLALSQPNGGLRIDTKYPKSTNGIFEWIAGTNVNISVNYEVTVPRTMDLQIEDTNGTIEASDIRGSHKIETTNGRILLTRCAGDVDAETTNGSIEAELTTVNAGRGMRLETTNGHISVRLPRTFAARIDAANTNGSIDTNMPVTTSGTHDKHELRGTINGGGPDLRLRTTNGSIHIQAI
ncbi:MAG: DUF4097 family beta strand repeat-containing protein [Thermoanaerobaculia bacterium]